MESYYSSDEEIAWGPISLREIKGDLKRGPIKKPNRRHTVHSKIQNTKMDESISEAVNKLDISRTSTAYYTPNESLKTNSNSEFLEKLSYVINVPSSELSEYASVLEHTENTNSDLEDIDTKIEPLIVPHNDSCMDFVMAMENRATQYNIENFQQTLVDNSYAALEEQISEEDSAVNKNDLEEQITSEEESPVNKNDLMHTKTETEVIILSDDSSSYVEDCEGISYDENITSFKKEVDLEVYESEITDECITTVDKTEHKYEPCKYNSEEQECYPENRPIAGNRFYDDIDACKEINHQYEEDTPLLTPNMQRKLSTIKESFSTSPVIVPEIDLTQFDDSLKDDSLQLNDTLEEMNRLLCQGINYSMSDDEAVEDTPVKENIAPQQHFTPSSEVASKKHLFSDTKQKPSHIPKYISTSAEKKINTNTITKASPKTNFKIPEIPSRPKFVTPTPPKATRHLKDIVSPVALYIKNSPRIPLKHNVPLKDLPRIATATSRKVSNKENFIDVEFPEVVYKPAKNQVATTEKHIIVPPYLRKLNVKEGHITKHEGRINRHLDRSKVSKQLLQSDITNSTIDQSLLDNSGAGDVSVLTNKQAFIK